MSTYTERAGWKEKYFFIWPLKIILYLIILAMGTAIFLILWDASIIILTVSLDFMLIDNDITNGILFYGYNISITQLLIIAYILFAIWFIIVLTLTRHLGKQLNKLYRGFMNVVKIALFESISKNFVQHTEEQDKQFIDNIQQLGRFMLYVSFAGFWIFLLWTILSVFVNSQNLMIFFDLPYFIFLGLSLIFAYMPNQVFNLYSNTTTNLIHDEAIKARVEERRNKREAKKRIEEEKYQKGKNEGGIQS